MKTPNRPPSCDLPKEFYKTKTKLKPCPFCGFKKIFQPTAILHKVHCYNCECYGPWYDRTGRKWNAIPRRSEVLELIRLVEHMYNSWDWDDANCREQLVMCADKLRKEMEV